MAKRRARNPHKPPEPNPDRTPGLEPGGSVPPGETPPESASATQGMPHPQEPPSRAATWIWLTVVAVVVLLVAAFFVFLAVGQVQ
ncbi:DUF6480 family protein [Saccharopolyspora thermophila]|uniref:DUF6480 family protein n=1 Tax=Saccharopolyspora thermophila TaxID=89367 RepID=UPI00227A1A21|nr:DUF6480 family protein [Saccharopolyspora subtropica]